MATQQQTQPQTEHQTQRTQISLQADAAVVKGIRRIAQTEGREFSAVIEDAMRQYIDAKDTAPKLSPEKAAMLKASFERNRRLGELLAQ